MDVGIDSCAYSAEVYIVGLLRRLCSITPKSELDGNIIWPLIGLNQYGAEPFQQQ